MCYQIISGNFSVFKDGWPDRLWSLLPGPPGAPDPPLQPHILHDMLKTLYAHAYPQRNISLSGMWVHSKGQWPNILQRSVII